MLSVPEGSEYGSVPGTGSRSDCSTAMADPMPNTLSALRPTVWTMQDVCHGNLIIIYVIFIRCVILSVVQHPL